MKTKEIEFDYDEEADTFYIFFGKPREAITEEHGNIAVHIDDETKEITGFTIIEFLRTLRKSRAPIRLLVEKSFLRSGTS